jgi:hypothetical protein
MTKKQSAPRLHEFYPDEFVEEARALQALSCHPDTPDEVFSFIQRLMLELSNETGIEFCTHIEPKDTLADMLWLAHRKVVPLIIGAAIDEIVSDSHKQAKLYGVMASGRQAAHRVAQKTPKAKKGGAS